MKTDNFRMFQYQEIIASQSLWYICGYWVY